MILPIFLPLAAIDGDTLRNACNARFRLATIDACELHRQRRPDCDAEQGRRAKADLERRLRAAREIRVEHVDADPCRAGFQAADRYGRKVVRVSVNGRDVGADMLRAGTVKLWKGVRCAR